MITQTLQEHLLRPWRPGWASDVAWFARTMWSALWE